MTQAPELLVSQWFNTAAELSLAALRGKVVVIEAFQMLCPGCILRGIPLAQSIARIQRRSGGRDWSASGV
tara:strand:- start:1535 stop:1744 length:210 start_codon:yes stop_codon:yes gene_type:complete